MNEVRRWRVDVVIDDVSAGDGGRTRARTLLREQDGTTLAGFGEATRRPETQGSVDALAVMRALTDLTDRLRETVRTDVAEQTLRLPPRRRLAEFAGYVGGGLMLGGAALLVATSWADLSRPGRIALLASTSAVLLLAGLIAAGRPLPRSRPPDTPTAAVRFRLGGVLLALAAGTVAITVGTIAGAHEAFWAGAAGLVVAVLGYVAVRTVAGLLASALLSAVTVGTLVAEVLDANSVVFGISFVLLGFAWAVLATTGVTVHPWYGHAVAAAIALIGAQQPLGEHAGWAYGLTFGVALVWLAGYLGQHSPVLLVAGILGITIAIPEAIWDWTDGAVGGAVLALIAGALLLAASWLGLRLTKRPASLALSTRESRARHP